MFDNNSDAKIVIATIATVMTKIDSLLNDVSTSVKRATIPFTSNILASANPPPKSNKIPQGNFSVSDQFNSGFFVLLAGIIKSKTAPNMATFSSSYFIGVRLLIKSLKIHKNTTPPNTKTNLICSVDQGFFTILKSCTSNRSLPSEK